MEPNPLVKKQLKPMVEGWRGAGLVDDATARRLLAAVNPGDAPTATAPERLLTRREVAGLLRVCPRTLDNWVERGLLRPRRCGPHLVRFDASEVARLGQQE